MSRGPNDLPTSASRAVKNQLTIKSLEHAEALIFSSPAPRAQRRDSGPAAQNPAFLGDSHPDAFIRTAPHYLLAMFLIHKKGNFAVAKKSCWS